MESFGSLLFAMGAGAEGLDFVTDLPLEASQTIFGYLDPGSLVSASHVSRRWLAACRDDSKLRQRARRYLRREKRRAARGGPVTVLTRGRSTSPKISPAPLPVFVPTLKFGSTSLRAKNTFVSRVNRPAASTKRSLRI